MQRRINVDSGRPLEKKAQYSRALRVNDLVQQSGTTAIDLDGNILGESVTAQVAAIFDIASASMGVAEGHLNNIVRVRAFVVGETNLRPAAEAISARFADQPIALTVIPISQLARPTQLVEIEFEAIDGAAASASPLPITAHQHVDVGGIAIKQRLLFSGLSTNKGDAGQQTQAIFAALFSRLDSINVNRGDLVCLRVFTRDHTTAIARLDDIAVILDGTNPVVSIFEVPPFSDTDTHIMIEAECVLGAGDQAQTTPHPQFNNFANTLSINDQIYLSNIAPLDSQHAVVAADDWGAQRDFCIEQLHTTLSAIGSSLDYVIIRRYFTHAAAVQNRAYGEGPSWFAATRPATLGCRIANHLHSGTVLTVEAHAVRGAGENIEWRKLD